MKTSYTTLALIAVAAGMLAQEPARFDHTVRNQFFAGFAGDAAALAEAMKISGETLAAEPGHFDYEDCWEMQKGDLSGFSEHSLGELLFGIAEGKGRMGKTEGGFGYIVRRWCSSTKCRSCTDGSGTVC